MLVVLNHLDTVPEGRRDAMLADIRRLLALDGLEGVPVLGISARDRIGVDTLRTEVVKRVADKKMARTRLEADLRAAAQDLEQQSGTAAPAQLSKDRVAALDDALADAAGVPTVVAAVQKSTRMRANRATGWPVVAWLSRLRPDPLKRLHLDLGSAGKALSGTARTSIPSATQVQRARVDTEVRAVADEVSSALTRPVGHRRPDRLGVPAARPGGPARRRARRDRPGGPADPDLGGAGAGAAVAADPVRPRRRGVAGRARGDGLPPAARDHDPRRARACRCRR